MNALKALFVMSMIVTVLVAITLVQLVITVLPYLAGALVVLLILRWRRPGTSTVAPPPAVRSYPEPRPRYHVGVPAAAPEGWVMVPVWVAPTPPAPKVIDAEVITGHD
jgi:hypothetical protein